MKKIPKQKRNNSSAELPGGSNILAAGKNAAIWNLNNDNRAAIYFNRMAMRAYSYLTDADIIEAKTR